MVAADNDRRRNLTLGHQIVDRDSELRAVGLTEPADSRWKSLKFYFLLSERDPALEMLVVGEKLEHERIRSRDIFGIAGKSNPTKWSFSFAEQRANVLRNETGDVESIPETGIERDSADVVSVIERDRAALLHLQHRRHVLDRRLRRALHVLRRVCDTQRERIRERHPRWHITIQHVVRARLVGQHIRRDAALHKLR